jgi:cytochrome b561
VPPQEDFGCNFYMHFGFYLLMVALVVIGLEAIYSLYQLATFVL